METAYLQGVNLIVRERNYNSYNTETAEFRHGNGRGKGREGLPSQLFYEKMKMTHRLPITGVKRPVAKGFGMGRP